MRNVITNDEYTYWQILRCAGTSTTRWLMGAGWWWRLDVDDHREVEPDHHFAFVRDPYKRYLSCLSAAYHHKDHRHIWSPEEFCYLVEAQNRSGDVFMWGDNPHFWHQCEFLQWMPRGGRLFTSIEDMTAFVPVDTEYPNIGRSRPSFKELAAATISPEPVYGAFADDLALWHYALECTKHNQRETTRVR